MLVERDLTKKKKKPWNRLDFFGLGQRTFKINDNNEKLQMVLMLSITEHL